MRAFTEFGVEQAVLAWLESVGGQVAHGPEIAPDLPVAERAEGATPIHGLREADPSGGLPDGR